MYNIYTNYLYRCTQNAYVLTPSVHELILLLLIKYSLGVMFLWIIIGAIGYRFSSRV